MFSEKNGTVLTKAINVYKHLFKQNIFGGHVRFRGRFWLQIENMLKNHAMLPRQFGPRVTVIMRFTSTLVIIVHIAQSICYLILAISRTYAAHTTYRNVFLRPNAENEAV